jgi:hypothetical protein
MTRNVVKRLPIFWGRTELFPIPISRVFVELGADRPNRGLENIDCSGAIRVTSLFGMEALGLSLQTAGADVTPI